MKKLIILICVLAVVSCTNEESDENNYVNFDTAVDFSIVNNIGENLLNPNHPNTIDISKIRIFYVVNGVKKLYYGGTNLDHPNGFMIFGSNYKKIRIFQNPSVTESRPKTIIEWGQNNSDVLEAKYRIYQNTPILLEEFWLNGTSVWTIADESNSETTYKSFKLIK
ncbi:hypothetical protein [Polaribacter uvawellassae]|uniref:hypothetical protein n=1 Tax=Polaribacter uvawellassae TaxID=3133495 RepID=UPI003219B6F5